MTPTEAMKRVEEIDEELAMYERMRLPRPDGKGPYAVLTAAGLQREEEAKAERTELVKQYGN